MSFACQFCPKVCTNSRGLTQHINRNKDCKEQQDVLLGVSGGFCLPTGTHTTTDTTASALRRSSRNRKPYSMAKAGASQHQTLEVQDVDVGSLDAPEAEDIEAEADEQFVPAEYSDLESISG